MASKNTDSVFRQTLPKIFVWSVIWSSGVVFLKIVLAVLYKVNISPEYMGGVGLSIFSHLVLGFLFGGLIFSRSGFLIRFIGYAAAVATFVFYTASFHHEIVFRSLPNPGFFYYLSEVAHLKSSLHANLPIGLFIIEMVFGCVLIFGGKSVAARIAEKLFMKMLSPRAAMVSLIAVLFVAIGINSPLSKIMSPDLFRGSREPVLWLLHTSLSKTEYETGADSIHPADIRRFQYEIGHAQQFGGVHPEYPLWTPRHIEAVPSENDSDIENVIMLILESVGVEEMRMEINGVPVMPNLSAIADENIFFENFFSGGTKSNQALPAIFAGLPPQTYRTFLWARPLPNFEGLPGKFRQKGYQTSYFHGSDLSFEQQRIFLQMAGFEDLFDYDPSLEKSVLGWGYDDETMLLRLRQWVESHGDEPYFTSLFTISSHDPFLIPDSHESVFTDKRPALNQDGTWLGLVSKTDQYELYIESLHFLDNALGDFYEWYKSEALPEKTLLVIVSDHVTSLHNESEEIENDHMRFSVPLIFAGIPEDRVEKYRQYQHRLSTHFDIPATLAGLLGMNPLPGDQGLDLFMPEENWPQNRLIYAVGGHGNERVYVWIPECQVEFDRYREQVTMINYEMPTHARDVSPVEAREQIEQRIIPFFQILFPLNQYLMVNNAYYPPDASSMPDFHPIVQAPAPIVVSHRGNTQGPASDKLENTPGAIEAAIQDGFEWVEVDIQLTADGVPVLLHDHAIEDETGELIDVASLKHEEILAVEGYENTISLKRALESYLDQIGFLIEVKPQKEIDRNYLLSRKISALIKDHPLKHNIMVDSFSQLSAMFIKNRCDCVVGFDAPYQQDLSREDLKAIRMMDMDWVYVHHDVATPDLIANAHEMGLRVMVYTINDPAVLDQWDATFYPDGIMTDYTDIKDAFLEKFQSSN